MSNEFMDTTNFIDNSVLDVIVPQVSQIDVEELLSSAVDQVHGGLDGRSLAASILQRDILYFGKSWAYIMYESLILLIHRFLADESISICVVIRVPYHDEPQLKSAIDRLKITIEAQAFGHISANSTGQGAQREPSPSQSRDVIWSGAVDMSQEPIIVVQQEDDQVRDRHVFVVWKVQAFLSRPRIRIQSPMITFKPVAILGPQQPTSHELPLDPYLPDCTPQSVNLLESLKGDPSLRGSAPRLPSSRLSRSASTAASLNFRKQALTVAAQRPFRAIPAISARVRYTRSKGDGGKPTIIASLDIESAPFFDNEVTITIVDIILTEGLAVDLSGGHALTLPMTCRPRDNLVFLFRLTPNGSISDGSNSNPRTLDIKIDATVLVSDVCHARIEMRWKAGVDFSTALNPSYGTPNQPMQRNKRPASLPVPPVPVNGNSMPAAPHATGSQSEAGVSPQRSLPNLVNNLSVTITLTAPRDVHVGVPFSWAIFVVNRSSISRKLAIMVIPKRRGNDLRDHISKPSSSSAAGSIKMGNINAVLDETHLYAMQRNNRCDTVPIVSLSPDVNLGLLNPGFCRNTELKFLPLAKGILSIEAIRVIDMATNDSIDIRDLPDIVVEERLVDD